MLINSYPQSEIAIICNLTCKEVTPMCTVLCSTFEAYVIFFLTALESYNVIIISLLYGIDSSSTATIEVPVYTNHKVGQVQAKYLIIHWSVNSIPPNDNIIGCQGLS